MKRVLLAVSLLAWTLSLSCNVNEYCLNCETGDGGPGDGNGDGPGDGNGDGNNGDGGPCINTGTEVCDGKDNDCDGITDEGVLPEVGDTCGSGMGACAGAVKQCVNGAIKCSKNPAPEQCNNVDDDCDGVVDNGDPGGGAKCGTDLGECVTGTLHCNPTSHTVTCGFGCSLSAGANCTAGHPCDCPIGIHCAVSGDCPPTMIDPLNFGVAESCDGKDNDCDNKFDEQIAPLGNCGGGPAGHENDGVCQQGQLVCDGAGGTKCVPIPPANLPVIGPSVEICNSLDDDCDGVPDNGFSTDSDPTNCGNCGNVCSLPNSFEGCVGGQCTIAACEPDFHNNNGQTADGCEFGPCTIQSSVEICNGIDDDCNPATGNNPATPCGNCAETGLTAPAGFTCVQVGACAGTGNSCHGTGGFQCDYGPTVSKDANNNIVPENKCDSIDNDCDGITDEAQFGTPNDNIPNKGAPCVEDGTLGTTLRQGACQGHGHVDCNPGNLTGPAICIIDVPGQAVPAAFESCDGKDNDCDGNVDEQANTGNLDTIAGQDAGQNWVNVPNHAGVQIMKYEASQPDATDTFVGTKTNVVCSRQDALPWVNITYPQAVAACSSINARLCTENEWQDMCMPRVTYPVAGPATANVDDFTFIEAEDFKANTTIGGANRAWTTTSPAAFNGTTFMQVPENGFFQASTANALTLSSRLDYQLNLNNATNYFVWARVRSPTVTTLPASFLSTAPAAGLAPTAPAGTAVNDLVIVITYSVDSGNGFPVHTLQGGFTQAVSSALDNNNRDSRLSVAFKVATVAGAQTYQAYTSSTGAAFTDSSGILVIPAGTYDTTNIVALADTNADATQAPDPPQTTPTANSMAFAIGAWQFQSSTTTTVGPPTNFNAIWDTAGATTGELALASFQAIQTAGSSLNPGRFSDNQSPTGTLGVTLFVPLASSRSVYLGLTAGAAAGNATQTMQVNADNQTQWVVSGQFTTSAAGTHTLSFYTRDDGLMIDTIAIARQNSNAPTLDNAWAYQTNPRTAQDTTCNADPFDSDGNAGNGDTDGAIPTGNLPACFANHGGQDAFDMSGNVKEWTRARALNQNPLRGGASNNEVIGTTCQLNFSLADDTFFFPNVGFRCCRGP